MKKCPMRDCHEAALRQWKAQIPNGMTIEEFLERSDLKTIAGVSYAEDSINTAINNFANSFGLSREGRDSFVAYLKGENNSFKLNVSVSKDELYESVMTNAFNVHDAWVVSNAGKFDREGREEQKFQHTKSQYIGYDELSMDLLFVYPVYQAADLELDPNELKEWFNNKVEQMFEQDKIHTVSDLRGAITAHANNPEWENYTQEQKDKLGQYKVTSNMLEQIMQRLPPKQLDLFIQSYDKTTAAYAYRVKNDGLIPTKKYEPAQEQENYRSDIASPLRRTIYDDSLAYAGMTPKEALEYAQTAPLEKLQETSAIRDSMRTAYDKLVNNPQLGIDEKTKQGFAEHCFGDKKDSPLDLSYMSKAEASRVIVGVLDDIHDKWVTDNAKKFNADRREFRTFQHMDTELIGWEEVSKDLMYGASVFEAAKMDFDEASLKRAYAELVQEYFKEHKITDLESFKAAIIEQSTDKEWDGYSNEQKENLQSTQVMTRTLEGVMQRLDDSQLEAMIQTTLDYQFKEECVRVKNDGIGPEPGYEYVPMEQNGNEVEVPQETQEDVELE